MVFIHPGFLWLLAAVPLMAGLHAGRRMGLRPLRAFVVAAIRTLAFAALVLALARPVMERPDSRQTLVAVADISGSLTDADLEQEGAALRELVASRKPGEAVRLVTFDSRAREVAIRPALLQPGGLAALRQAASATGPAKPGSALADALELAGALVPHDGRGRIVAWTDGLETGGDAEAAAGRLAERGIAVSVSPVGRERTDGVVLRSVSLPASAAVGSTVELRADVESARATTARVIVRNDDTHEEVVRSVALAPGRQIVTANWPLRAQGTVRLSLRVECDGTVPGENALPAAIRGCAPLRVLVVEDADAQPTMAAASAILGESATVTGMTPAALSAEGAFEAVDLLVVADVSAEAIGREAQERLKQAVMNGLGVLVTGGRRSFGPGGYANTPLADVLPVSFSQKVERRDPSATLVVIIDTSGSMGGPRVNLAKEIARLAISRLKPHDKAGIVEFYGSKRWAAPIQPASNAIDLQRALNRLSSGGGTVILPAIEEAYYALQNVRTRTRHVLVLTDGGVETGPFEAIVRKMADSGMTLSTVLVGPGTDTAFLASLAQWGRGRFYTAPDRFNLPEIIVKQPESSLLSPFVEQPTAVRARAGDPITEGIDFAAAPPIAGYVETEAKPTADVVLVSELGHPLVARWQYGLGRVAVFTSQLGGSWSAELSRWPSFANMMANLARCLASTRTDEALTMRVVPRPGAIELQIENRRTDRGPVVGPVELAITRIGGATTQLTLDPIRPNEWNTRLSRPDAGVYEAAMRTTDGQLAGAAAFAVPPVREVTGVGPDRDLVARVHAANAPAAARAQGLSAAPARNPWELWPVLAGAALALVLFNVLVRRWPRSPGRVPTTAAVVAFFAVFAGPAGPGAVAAQRSPTPTRPAATRPQPPASQPVTTTARNQPETKPVPPPPNEALAAIEEALRSSDRAWADERFAEGCRVVLLRDGRLDALIAHLQPLAKVDVRTAWFLARAAREQGDLELARQTLTDLTARSAADADAWGELARIEEMLGHDPAALAGLDRALAATHDTDRLYALRIRRALILYDAPDRAPAREALQAIARERPEALAICAHLAALNGDDETAAALMGQVREAPGKRYQEHLFRGLFLMRANQPDLAGQEFERAYAESTLARDRRFALERIITAARQAGGLKALADRWMAEPRIGADKLAALVALLRELGLGDAALSLLRRPAETPDQRELIESADFQRDLITVAIEAGRSADAEKAYQGLVAKEPQRVEWRVGLARLRLLDGRRAEGLSVFREATESLDDPRGLMALADAARQLGLDEVALAAARKAGAKGAAARVRSALFEADLLRQRAQPDRAIALLKKLVASVGDDYALLPPVADAFERYGDKAEALRLHRRLYEATRAEDTLLRVAWLLEENQRFDEAYALWADLWRTTETAARQRQAQDHLLDLASKTGRMADLAIETEQRLADGHGGERDLSLLIEIYTRANDPVSAAEILQDLGRRSGSQVDTLKRLAKVYLSCEQFGRCNAVLRRLATLDPANAGDYLQQIAIMAVERKQPQQARAALAELETVAPKDEWVDEFSAGVLDMSGFHREAADRYGRALARHPDHIEVLLLWGNAMKAAGQSDMAVARFQNLVEEADEDDLFTVAIDGLLNLNARPPSLRSALRRVYSRIAVRPNRVFLYQLAGDLLESLGRAREVGGIMEQALVVGGERRGPMLRELMDSAKADGQVGRAIQFGRSLLALGEEVPPQVFLDLGESMIREGDLAGAERVFERAAAAGDYSAIRQRVATCLENANLPARAERIVRELLISEPDNVPLLIHSGRLCEQLGDYARAFDQYEHAADLMLRRLPGSIAAEETAAGQTTGDDTSRTPRRPFRAANLDETEQFFESAGNGLRSAARTQALRDRLLKTLPERVEEELNALTAARAIGPAIDRNPRLDHLAKFARAVTFSLHNPDAADGFDRKLLERYPNDRRLRAAIIKARTDWGLYGRAAAFLAEGEKTAVAGPGLEVAIADPERLRAILARPSLEATLACRVVPLLIVTGRDDEARRAVRSASASPALVPQVAPRMLAAALALNDREAVRQWADAWLDSCRRSSDGYRVAAAVEACIGMTWNHRTPDERRDLVSRLGQMAAAMEGPGRLPMDLLRMRFAEAAGFPFEDLDAVLAEAIQDKGLGASVLAGLLAKAPAEARPDLLTKIIQGREPAARRPLLMGIAGALTAPADERLVATFESLFKASPKQRLDPERGYWQAQEAGWNSNRDQPELGHRLAEVLLSESPGELAILVAAAGARANAGRHDEARILIREALEALLAVKKPDHQQVRMLGEVARLLQPADARAVVADLDDRLAIEGASPVVLLAKGILLDTLGDADGAIESLSAAFQMQPGERVYSMRLISVLKQAGRPVQLSRLLAASLTKSTIMEAFEWRTLLTLYCDLYDLRNAAKTVQKDETPLAPIEAMRVARLMGRIDDVVTTFRRFHTNNRDTGRFYSPFWPAPPSVGGMAGYLERQKVRNVDRDRLFAALADLPFAESEYAALLLAAPPEQGDVAGLVDGLLKATRLNGTRAGLVRSLLDAHRQNALNAKDRRMLLVLAADEPASIPQDLVPALDDILLHTDPADSAALTMLARFRHARGDLDGARRILRWVVAADLSFAQRSGSIADEFARIDAYLATLPEAERDRERRRLLEWRAPTPLATTRDDADGFVLDRWAALGDAEETARIADRYRKAIQADRSAGSKRVLLSALARCDAVAGRLNEFKDVVGRLAGGIREDLITAQPLDCRQILPEAARLRDPAQCLDALVAVIETHRSAGTLGRGMATRTLCLAVQWCAENGLPDRAKAVLQRATEAAGPVGEHWLWIADAARACGQSAQAAEIETRLLDADMLPVLRVPDLLDVVEQAKGREAADAIAVRVAAYSDHPAVLRRAMRAAQRRGDNSAANAYSDRLRQTGGDVPDLGHSESRPAASRPAATQTPPASRTSR